MASPRRFRAPPLWWPGRRLRRLVSSPTSGSLTPAFVDLVGLTDEVAAVHFVPGGTGSFCTYGEAGSFYGGDDYGLCGLVSTRSCVTGDDPSTSATGFDPACQQPEDC